MCTMYNVCKLPGFLAKDYIYSICMFSGYKYFNFKYVAFIYR